MQAVIDSKVNVLAWFLLYYLTTHSNTDRKLAGLLDHLKAETDIMTRQEVDEMMDDDERFKQWLHTQRVNAVLSVPGVLELVMDDFNNDWIHYCESLLTEN